MAESIELVVSGDHTIRKCNSVESYVVGAKASSDDPGIGPLLAVYSCESVADMTKSD